MSDFWSNPSSTSRLYVCEQRRLWRDRQTIACLCQPGGGGGRNRQPIACLWQRGEEQNYNNCLSVATRGGTDKQLRFCGNEGRNRITTIACLWQRGEEHNYNNCLSVATRRGTELQQLPVCGNEGRNRQISQLMRLWLFSSSVNTFFKRACADIQ